MTVTHDPPLPPGWEQTLEDARLGAQPRPSVARMVHYVGRTEPACWPGIITNVVSTTVVDLTVFNPLPSHFRGVALDPGGGPGTWHWPERVG